MFDDSLLEAVRARLRAKGVKLWLEPFWKNGVCSEVQSAACPRVRYATHGADIACGAPRRFANFRVIRCPCLTFHLVTQEEVRKLVSESFREPDFVAPQKGIVLHIRCGMFGTDIRYAAARSQRCDADGMPEASAEPCFGTFRLGCAFAVRCPVLT